jgi:hypothetical protein
LPKHWEYPASMPGSASNAAHVSKGSLKDFQQQRLERNHIQVTRAEPFLSQRSSSSQAVNKILAFSSESSIVDPTVQLPQWYQLLRQSAQDFWRVTSIAYRLANHLLGSLFEVRIILNLDYPEHLYPWSPLPSLHETGAVSRLCNARWICIAEGLTVWQSDSNSVEIKYKKSLGRI